MTQKQKISLRLAENEVVVVGPIERWQHLILIYESYAHANPEEKDTWLAAADWVRGWISKSDVIDYDEEW